MAKQHQVVWISDPENTWDRPSTTFDNFGKDPVYVTQANVSELDWAVKNTFLDFGPHVGGIGGPLRHVASAEGCLASLASYQQQHDDESEKTKPSASRLVPNTMEKRPTGRGRGDSTVGDLPGDTGAFKPRTLRQIGSAGSVGSRLDQMGNENQGELYGIRRINSVGSRLVDFDPLSIRSHGLDDGGAPESGPNPSDPVWVQHRGPPANDASLTSLSNSYLDYEDGPQSSTWEPQIRESWEGWNMHSGDVVVDQKDDVWQVKNTFLDFEPPQAYPMRPVRSAMGRLADLGALGDEK